MPRRAPVRRIGAGLRSAGLLAQLAGQDVLAEPFAAMARIRRKSTRRAELFDHPGRRFVILVRDTRPVGVVRLQQASGTVAGTKLLICRHRSWVAVSLSSPAHCRVTSARRRAISPSRASSGRYCRPPRASRRKTAPPNVNTSSCCRAKAHCLVVRLRLACAPSGRTPLAPAHRRHALQAACPRPLGVAAPAPSLPQRYWPERSAGPASLWLRLGERIHSASHQPDPPTCRPATTQAH